MPGRDLAATFHSVASVAWALPLIGLVVRFRRADPVERDQIKYLILAGIGLVASAITSNVLTLPVIISDVVDVVDVVTFAAVPAVIGAAVSRYRLYDIDRVVNKTIVYLIVTGSTLAVYVATVSVVGLLAAGPRGSLNVAVATLAAAAAFRPVLARVQRLVDRRFYRHKYNAATTVTAFGAHVRDETDLDDLSGALVAIVAATVRPAYVTLWLGPGP